MIERGGLTVEVFRLLQVERFNEVCDRCKASVAITTDPAVMALKVGAELAVRAKPGDDVAVVEVVGAGLFQGGSPSDGLMKTP